MKTTNICITNNNPQEIEYTCKYDEKYNIHRVDLTLKHNKVVVKY